MAWEFLWKGLVIGLSIAAPVGPIGVLCIRRSLADGFHVGFATGLGAAIADATYGCVAAFGLTAISSFLVSQRAWLAIVGGVFLCYLGIRTLLAKPVLATAEARGGTSLLAACASTVALTLTNPLTILSFVAVFAGFGLGAAPSYSAATIVVFGVFVGSALWWLTLSSAVSLLRRQLTTNAMLTVNRISGAVITLFGVLACWRGIAAAR